MRFSYSILFLVTLKFVQCFRTSSFKLKSLQKTGSIRTYSSNYGLHITNLSSKQTEESSLLKSSTFVPFSGKINLNLFPRTVSMLLGKFLLAISIVFSFSTNNALAAVNLIKSFPISPNQSPVKINGWDLYGRVPHDDWLFSTWRLTDPNFYKRSITETVKDELPPVLANFRRRKLLSEFIMLRDGFTVVAIFSFFFWLTYRYAVVDGIARLRKAQNWAPTSARSKKGPRKGLQVSTMEKGWLDMDLEATPAKAEKDKSKDGDKSKEKKNGDEDEGEDEDQDTKDGDKDTKK